MNDNNFDSAAYEGDDPDSCAFSISGTSVSGVQETQKKEEPEVIAKSETKAVAWIRFLVFFVLIASAIGAALTVYFYVSGAEG